MKRTSRHIAAALLLSLYLPLVLTAQFWHVHGTAAAGDGRITVAGSVSAPRHAGADTGMCPACQLASETGTSIQQVPSLPAEPSTLPARDCSILLQRLAGPSAPRSPPCS